MNDAQTTTKTYTYRIETITGRFGREMITHFEVSYKGRQAGYGWTLEELQADFLKLHPQFSACTIKGDKLIAR